MSQPRSARVVSLGLLAAYATVLNILEAPLPRILPWAKPGLANAAALVALVTHGAGAAVLVSLVRVLLAGLLLGTLLTPGWVMGASGALAATATMALVLRASPPLGLISVSAAGAAASSTCQVLVAAGLLAGHGGLGAALPLVIGTSVPAGLVVGALAALSLRRLPAWVLGPAGRRPG